jgi:hypothetical protein
VEFVVDKTAFAQVFSEYFSFPYQFACHLLPQTHHPSCRTGAIGQIVTGVTRFELGTSEIQIKCYNREITFEITFSTFRVGSQRSQQTVDITPASILLLYAICFPSSFPIHRHRLLAGMFINSKLPINQSINQLPPSNNTHKRRVERKPRPNNTRHTRVGPSPQVKWLFGW